MALKPEIEIISKKKEREREGHQIQGTVISDRRQTTHTIKEQQREEADK
jgi:hypothetical protein